MPEQISPLLSFIRSLLPFSDESWQSLQPALTQLEYKKGTYLLREGAISNAFFFIENGYCRSCYNKDGVEKNTAFYFEGDIAANIKSFGSGEPSAYHIIACEPLTAIAFDKPLLMAIAQQVPEVEALGRHCIRRFATRQEEFAQLFALFSAEERYTYLETHWPAMLQRVSLTQLSSFLGIARETLSRIRKRRSQHGL